MTAIVVDLERDHLEVIPVLNDEAIAGKMGYFQAFESRIEIRIQMLNRQSVRIGTGQASIDGNSSTVEADVFDDRRQLTQDEDRLWTGSDIEAD